ncbi:hypothetical protein TVAG_421260 [Trichomonas vaginalis G3]|uniref:DUF3447 domain-containing protein n=1 Tax=Trichomonas vaginalis (strain ATCC PRA-98 / G3) TaxID=412133 RepID=A2EVV2_TRIV3|nr:spectrin binding [Trichomonas vaginalis G3]EAY03239.1 hypothetical protein TVAG_421260 [Trichomonas vaginalis G3]KAI5550837.1 spectrin binding [Trichomonas vaginalis G3]|eukprot:XP_001315462.1 hypothetical protein [Trichomonas vaginalis G3]
MSECLKYQEPYSDCMKFAIISHNIDFVTFLINEYDIEINLRCCGKYNNLEALLIYFDQTNDFQKCFVYSAKLNIISLIKYFLSFGPNINEEDRDGHSALYTAVCYNDKETAELLISHGANINKI